MHSFRFISILILSFQVFTASKALAQEQAEIRWMSFEEMEKAFAEEPKHVFIDFWAEWCAACKRMEKYVFSNPEVADRLNQDYYPVRMNAETKDSIYFGGKLFINPTQDRKRVGFHELAVLLGKNEEGQFSLPTVAIYDSKFQPVARYDKYLNSKKMLNALVISSNKK